MSLQVEAGQCQSQVTKGRSIALWTGCPKTRLFKFLASWILVPLWARLTPVKPLPGGPHPSFQRGDNVQCMMNLIMPLKDKSPVGRAQAALAIAQNKDAIFAGLNNVGTVHFARFVIVGDNICMFSVYDGDFTNYIRDFIATIGSVFNAVVELVEGGEKVIPARRMSRHSSSGCTSATCTRCRTPPPIF